MCTVNCFKRQFKHVICGLHGKIGLARDGQGNQESKQPDSLHSDMTYLTFVSYAYS